MHQNTMNLPLLSSIENERRVVLVGGYLGGGKSHFAQLMMSHIESFGLHHRISFDRRNTSDVAMISFDEMSEYPIGLVERIPKWDVGFLPTEKVKCKPSSLMMKLIERLS